MIGSKATTQITNVFDICDFQFWKRKTIILSFQKWQFFNIFWSFFCKLHKYLSQNWGSVGHFDVLNKSESQLVQKLWHPIQKGWLVIDKIKNTQLCNQILTKGNLKLVRGCCCCTCVQWCFLMHFLTIINDCIKIFPQSSPQMNYMCILGLVS